MSDLSDLEQKAYRLFLLGRLAKDIAAELDVSYADAYQAVIRAHRKMTGCEGCSDA